MKKTKKRVLGLLGLSLVAATTVFAAFLPGPEASATNVTSVTDTIVVRVVGSVPDVNIKPPEGTVVVYPDQTFTYSFENVKTLDVTIKYTDKDGVEHIYTLPAYDADYNPGELSLEMNLLDEGYGYGEYEITVTGEGYDGVSDADSIHFAFYPVIGKVTEDENDGLAYLDLTYDTENEEIHTIGINIYDANGDLVGVLSPITVTSPNTRVELPFSEKDVASGKYRIEITAYNGDGEALYLPYITYADYQAIPVPDTGAPFSNLNISKTDYLITGLLIFFAAAILGLIFVAKGRDSRKRIAVRRRRR